MVEFSGDHHLNQPGSIAVSSGWAVQDERTNNEDFARHLPLPLPRGGAGCGMSRRLDDQCRREQRCRVDVGKASVAKCGHSKEFNMLADESMAMSSHRSFINVTCYLVAPSEGSMIDQKQLPLDSGPASMRNWLSALAGSWDALLQKIPTAPGMLPLHPINWLHDFRV